MGYGISSAAGIQGGFDELKQMLAQRVAARQYADRMNQQAFENQRQLAGDQRASQAQAIDQQRYAAQEAQRQAADAEAARKNTYAEADKMAEQYQPGTEFMPSSPTVATMQAGGRGEDLQPRMTLPSRQMTGGGVTPEASGSFPEAQPAQGFLRTTTRTQAKPEVYIKTATQKQMDTLADNQRADAAANARQGESDWRLGIQQQLADMKGGQGQTSSYQLQPEIDPTTGQQTGRFLGYNTKANRFEPVNGATPSATKAAPGAAQNAQHEQSKHEALGSLDQLDQAIEAAKDLIGPGAGRVSSVQQMIGNPDPKIQALGTKMLLAKMQVDHAASGTVRAGASPQLLARWDNILGNVQNAEGLKAAVQAMREILGGQAAAPAGARKRYNPVTGRVE